MPVRPILAYPLSAGVGGELEHALGILRARYLARSLCLVRLGGLDVDSDCFTGPLRIDLFPAFARVVANE